MRRVVLFPASRCAGFALVASFVAALLLGSLPLIGADANALATQINTQLRAAERTMFAGKQEEADAQVKAVATLLEELKTADPDHRNLKTLQSKYDKLRKDLDRRLGKAAPSTAPVVTPPAAPKPPAPKPAGSLTASQQAAMERALAKAVKDVDYALGKLESLMADRDQSAGVETPLQRRQSDVARFLDEAEGYLGKAEEKYAGNLPDPNPEFVAARGKIAAARQKSAAWLEGLQAEAAKTAASEADAAAQTAAKAARAQADADRMIELYTEFHEALDSMHGNSVVYDMDLEKAKEALAKVETLEKEILPKLAPDLGRLAETYGKTGMDINNHLFEQGIRADGDPGGKLARMMEAVANIPKTRTASADSLERYATILLGAFSDQLTDVRIKRMNDAKALLVVAQGFDPKHEATGKLLGTIDNQILQAVETMKAQIDAKEWAGNVKEFAGPGEPAELAKAALEFFRKDDRWGANPTKKVEVLAVCVRGPWKVAERDIFGRVISWRLPIHVAVTDESLRPRNIARVYELSILALEGPPNQAPQKPPFEGYWVGNNWMMRLSRF
ncbi:MAG: hypothetical protein H7A46_20440 [Verrucomicrobiales bacterium]|nr:hypothetical protein [Verrucomicrobiales bacterium]